MAVTEAVRLIAQKEGPLALFKGATARALWVSPLGAMNFAGYELARRAMDTDSDVPALDHDEEVELEPEEDLTTTQQPN